MIPVAPHGSIRVPSVQQHEADCFAFTPFGQQSMSAHSHNKLDSSRNVTSWQCLRLESTLVVMVGLLCLPFGQVSYAQLYDALDAYPPRWNLGFSDCDARIVNQEHLVDGGENGRACESISFKASHGTEVQLVYAIEPVRAIDDLVANVSVMSAKSGCQIGFRIRFPYHRDDETGSPVSTTVFGTSYRDAGTFARIGVGSIERSLRLKIITLRSEYGAAANLRDPYVDAVVLNAYCGPGTTTLRVDELRVDGMVPIGAISRVPADQQSMRVADETSVEGLVPAMRHQNAFPTGRVTRILQHNGEPLSWVRSLGFDAVLLSTPPTSEILRDAIRSGVAIYAPPPSSPDPSLQPLLEPVAGWYLGSELALDRQDLDQASRSSRRLRGFPALWQRPIIAAPAEAFREYAPLVDALVDDLPVRCRGVSASEEVDATLRIRKQMGGRVESAVGIASSPPQAATSQADAIARAIGAPTLSSFRWHGMWLQAIRSLRSSPKAMIFRSSRSLSSGDPLDSQRAMALSYVNRMIAMIAPWVAGATPRPAPTVSVPEDLDGGRYECGRLVSGPTEVLLIGSTACRGNEVLAGDGATLEVSLSPMDVAKTMWRLTHFSAERVSPEQTSMGPKLQIVSPDVVEIIVMSSDPGMGALLSMSAERFARQAALDRWQLTAEKVRQTGSDWQAASAARAVTVSPPTDLIAIAQRTLNDAEPLYRAGDIHASLRMARRADAWALRSDWQLTESLMPDWPNPTSCPTVVCGAAAIQTAWSPLMRDQGWGRNRLTSGTLDSKDLLGGNRWTFGRRQSVRANSDVQLVSRGVFSGAGALRTTVTPSSDRRLVGGYEGTMIQIQSPSIHVPAGRAIRIDAMVRTLGFGGPHQGLLVYDTIGGQEMGLLVRGHSDWTPVRLYRQSLVDGEVNVMFEVIGAGEVMIDEVELRIWEPRDESPILMRPIQPSLMEPLRVGDGNSETDGQSTRW